MTTADEIKAEYDQSGHDRHDLKYAIQRLLSECADEFDSEESAVMFLHTEV